MSGLPAPRDGGCALVTGASAGIGEEIARDLAARGHAVVLVARRVELLQALATELTKEHGVRAAAVACDLTEADARDGLPDAVASLGVEVDILVNNAGFATGGRFTRSERQRELDQVRILCEAVVDLSSMFIPGMVERGSGAVLNVASTAGMQPMPWSAGYSAAKAHTLAFSEALHYELRPKGVSVTALCPGPVTTDFWEEAGEQPIEEAMPKPMWVSPKRTAKVGVSALASGRRVAIPGKPIQVMMFGGRFVPNAVKLPAVARAMRPRA